MKKETGQLLDLGIIYITKELHVKRLKNETNKTLIEHHAVVTSPVLGHVDVEDDQWFEERENDEISTENDGKAHCANDITTEKKREINMRTLKYE